MNPYLLQSLDKKKIYFICFLILVLVVSFLLFYPKNCKDDINCFNDLALKCSRAKVIASNNGDLYSYEIKGKKENGCIIIVFLKFIQNNNNPILKGMLENKGMICNVPLEIIQLKPISDLEDLSDYCTGPLKEAAIEVTLEKLYSIVVANLGEIGKEYQNVLKAATTNNTLISNSS
ncbi:MAG TPA: hypothetical protein VJB89_02025 [Candidatus Nanoarchaeia archaeon]|nr:hypothetical protein [Candidatus Nanoarchaeia archaeon]